MPDAPDGGKRIGRVRVILTAWAIMAAALGIYIFLSPQQDGTRWRIVRMARALGRLVGLEDRPRKPIGVIVREIEQGDEARKAQTIVLCNELTEAELAQVFPHLIRAMKDESEMVRNASATVVGDLSPRLSGEAPVAEEALTALLDDPSAELRARAAKSLGSIAASGRLDAPPPRLVACLDDEDEHVRFMHDRSPVRVSQGARNGSSPWRCVAFRLKTSPPATHSRISSGTSASSLRSSRS